MESVHRDTPAKRKRRGAFFTPRPIAEFLAEWAIGGNQSATVLDPTCGDGVFLLAAGSRLSALGRPVNELDDQVFGVDIHSESLDDAERLLGDEGLDARLLESDFFELVEPGRTGARLPQLDAVIGNPPFVRYHTHRGETRRIAAEAAMRQGVRLSALASSWAPALVHASAFLKPEGRLAMVLPAELLTVHYAEPIRRWLADRFAEVGLVVFEQLQFDDALENVVLLLASGTGGCDSFSLYFVDDANDLDRTGLRDELSVTPSAEGKWTDLLLPEDQRLLFRSVAEGQFETLESYGRIGLGTVTGSNNFFALTEETRVEYDLDESQLVPISPPGTRHLRGTAFGRGDWKRLRDEGQRVWLLRPESDDKTRGLGRYISHGRSLGVHEAYKCQIRDPWWRPPAVDPPDLFFTYMSHRFPRLVANTARTSFLNSMHGVWIERTGRVWLRQALPLLALNSVTMLGAEVLGRSYGGGVLKMEPREAAELPVPEFDQLEAAWKKLKPSRSRLDRELRRGQWTLVLAHVDEILLQETMGVSATDAASLHNAARSLRERRLTRKVNAR